MEKIIPGVVFKQKFVLVSDSDSSFSGYLDYMERPEAFAIENHEKDKLYTGFLEYMKNEEKSDGLFNFSSSCLTDEEVDEQKKIFNQSQKNGCPMYVSVISFDNDYLKEHRLLNESGTRLDTHRLKDITRSSVVTLLKETHLDPHNVIWNGAIHTNTDNIHIHLSFIELEKVQRKYDRLEKTAFDKLKSNIVNSIVGNEKVAEISKLYREELIPNLKQNFSADDKILLELAEKLPANISWQYDRPEFAPYRKFVDDAVNKMISGDPKLKKLFNKFNKTLDEQQDEYRRSYGDGERHLWKDYKKNKLNDFYKRAGNSVLAQIKKNNIKELQEKYSQTKEKYNNSKGIQRLQNFSAMNSSGTDLLRQTSYTLKQLKYEHEKHMRELVKEFEQDIQKEQREYNDLLSRGRGV